MKVYELGNSSDFISIIGTIHGDEPKTLKVINTLKQYLNNKSLNKKVKLIFANERAYKSDERFENIDMNRTFPGDPNGNNYEERIAWKIYNEVKNGQITLSLHSSKSCPPPFIISEYLDNHYKDLIRLPVKFCVYDNTSGNRGTLDSVVENALTLEMGEQKTESAYRNGTKICKELIKSTNVINEEVNNKSNIEVIKVKDTLKKSMGEPNVYYNNFEKVPKGEIIASDRGVSHISLEDNTTPILMSENGYDEIFGLVGEFSKTVRGSDLV